MGKGNSNSILKKSLIGIFLLVLAFGCQDDLLNTGLENDSENIELKSAAFSEYMVISRSETLPGSLQEQIQAFGVVIKTVPEIGLMVVSPTTDDFEKKVGKLNGVMGVVPNLRLKGVNQGGLSLLANPPSIGDDEDLFYLQWALDAIDAPQAWNAGYTGANTRVFILDTGIDPNHPDLEQNLNTELSKSFVPGESYAYNGGFWAFHGIMIAGIIAAADNQVGIIGVAPDAEIVALKVFSEFSGEGQISWVCDAIVYAANNGADVMNMSFGWLFYKNGFYYDENGDLQKVPAVYIQNIIHVFKRAVDYADKKGVVMVVAAGNDGLSADGNGSLFDVPASFENVITVSATAPDYWYGDLVNGITDTNFDIPAHYTTYGRSFIDIAAPGGDYDYAFLGEFENWWYDGIIAPVQEPFGYWEWGMGTSFAAPHVVGVAALIISKNGGQMNPRQVRQQLLNTADPIDCNGQSPFFGKGRVNAYRAVTE
jgi:subtilisin family serine protease